MAKFEVLVSAKLSNDSVKNIKQQLDSVSLSVSKTVSDAAKGSQGIADIIGKFSKWQLVGDAIHGVKDGMSDMVNQVFELDESLTELDKVTDLTQEGLKGLTDDAFDVGQQIGATAKDVIDATTIFAQAGYQAQDALDLGEQAIMLKNVSEAGATAEKSANTLIAAMKAFNIDASESSHIVDALNEVDTRASRCRNAA